MTAAAAVTVRDVIRAFVDHHVESHHAVVALAVSHARFAELVDHLQLGQIGFEPVPHVDIFVPDQAWQGRPVRFRTRVFAADAPVAPFPGHPEIQGALVFPFATVAETDTNLVDTIALTRHTFLLARAHLTTGLNLAVSALITLTSGFSNPAGALRRMRRAIDTQITRLPADPPEDAS